MKKIILTLAIISATLNQSAHAGGITLPSENEMSSMSVVLLPTYVTFSPTMALSDLSDQKKIVMRAHDDIAYFVATDGAVRTARFNQALAVVREMSGDQSSQDMELAEAILSEAR